MEKSRSQEIKSDCKCRVHVNVKAAQEEHGTVQHHSQSATEITATTYTHRRDRWRDPRNHGLAVNVGKWLNRISSRAIQSSVLFVAVDIIIIIITVLCCHAIQAKYSPSPCHSVNLLL